MSSSPEVHLVLFDLDGTLTDAAPGILNGIRYALDDMGIEHPPDETMRTFLGPPLVDTFGGHFGMTEADVDKAIAKYREHYHDIGLFENRVYDGIPELLTALGALEITLAVATSKPTYSAKPILEHFGLAEHFAFIGGAELDGSRNRKSDVITHTLKALASLGVRAAAAETVMVGDRRHDVIGAGVHDIDCVGVLWGYGTADELTKAGAATLVASPSELLEVLQGQDI